MIQATLAGLSRGFWHSDGFGGSLARANSIHVPLTGGTVERISKAF